MLINFKNCNLDCFKKKETYTPEEAMQIIEAMQLNLKVATRKVEELTEENEGLKNTIRTLQEELEKSTMEKEEPDMYEDYRLGLL